MLKLDAPDHRVWVDEILQTQGLLLFFIPLDCTLELGTESSPSPFHLSGHPASKKLQKSAATANQPRSKWFASRLLHLRGNLA